ncbi:MAG: hypothetical protein U0903_15030 [Planctomycetales bacterium]
MDAIQTVELNDMQKELVLEGLRYVRSARKLAFRDPLGAPDQQRESELVEVAQLISRLNGTETNSNTARV